MKYKILTMVVLIVLCVGFCAGTAYLPEIGDPESAPNTHISDYYIEHSEEDTAEYRSRYAGGLQRLRYHV